jgi:hypothetical protein
VSLFFPRLGTFDLDAWLVWRVSDRVGRWGGHGSPGKNGHDVSEESLGLMEFLRGISERDF